MGMYGEEEVTISSSEDVISKVDVSDAIGCSSDQKTTEQGLSKLCKWLIGVGVAGIFIAIGVFLLIKSLLTRRHERKHCAPGIICKANKGGEPNEQSLIKHDRSTYENDEFTFILTTILFNKDEQYKTIVRDIKNLFIKIHNNETISQEDVKNTNPEDITSNIITKHSIFGSSKVANATRKLVKSVQNVDGLNNDADSQIATALDIFKKEMFIEASKNTSKTLK